MSTTTFVIDRELWYVLTVYFDRDCLALLQHYCSFEKKNMLPPNCVHSSVASYQAPACCGRKAPVVFCWPLTSNCLMCCQRVPSHCHNTAFHWGLFKPHYPRGMGGRR